MDDLVTRLRVSWPMAHYADRPPAIQIEAAAEIERLRRQRDELISILQGISRQTAEMVKAHS